VKPRLCPAWRRHRIRAGVPLAPEESRGAAPPTTIRHQDSAASRLGETPGCARSSRTAQLGARRHVVSRRNGRILMANAQAARPFGYSADELLGERVDTLVPNLLPATSSRRGTGPARPGGEGRPDVPGPSSEAGRAGAGGGVRGGLARELHEGTAQRLAALAMRLASPAQASRGSPRRADERWARHAPSPDSAWARFAASPSRSASAPPPIRASAL